MKRHKKSRILKAIKLSAATIEQLKAQHEDEVHGAIREIDRRDARSLAQAPFIVVTNATGAEKK